MLVFAGSNANIVDKTDVFLYLAYGFLILFFNVMNPF